MTHSDIDPALEPWRVTETDRPGNASRAQLARYLLRYAILAPSGHNTQPWLFRIGEQAVELFADPSRALPVVDPDNRELVISCGAALETFCLAAEHFGQRCHVEVLPDRDDEDFLARIRLESDGNSNAADDALFAAIPNRRTNRRQYADRELGTDTDEPSRLPAAGRALMRILLRCCAAGVSASFLNQPVEVVELRPLLAHTIGRDGSPQLLLRLGYATPVEPQPRRPVDEVLI